MYIKVFYEEYIDSIFFVKKEKLKYFGFFGFVIWVEVGDVIEVVFKNNVRKLGCDFFLKFFLIFVVKLIIFRELNVFCF